MTRRLFFVLSSAVVLALVLSARSELFARQETPDYESLSLEDMLNLEIVTATKTASKIDDTPALVEVVTDRQIEQRGYRHLADVLNDIPDNHEDRSNWGIGEPLYQNTAFGFRFDTGQNILVRPSEIQIDPFAFTAFQEFRDDPNDWLFDPNASRTTVGLFGQIDYDLGQSLTLSAGARSDRYTGSGSLDQVYTELNPRGGLVYKNRAAGNFKILYGPLPGSPMASRRCRR